MTIHDMRPLEMVGDLCEKYYKHPRKFVGRLLMMLGLNNLRQYFIQKRKYAVVLRKQRKIFEQPNFRIVTVSEHSKMAMMSFIPSLKMNDVQVFYSPSTVDEKLQVPQQKKELGKYYLIVSGNRWLKNSVRAIIAFDQLFTDRPNLEGRVVITGLKSFDQITLKIKNKDRFKCVGYVDEIELASLYQNAYALIYPSLNEGFGYPPLEAMYRGCPVIASATASITEICGDSVIYFNPYLIKEIQMRVLSLENERLRDDIIKKGKEREHLIRIKQKKDLCDLCKYILSLGE
jgi:glycosyltransferase involved in cell wall biosynthesis